MNLSSVNSSSNMMIVKRPDSSKITDDLFSTLDTKGKGYLDKNDLASVFSTDSFSKLDTDRNGKITKVEMKAALEKLAATLDAPLQTRLQGQMPPPPPQGAGQNDQGLTKDQLTSMSKEASEQANVMSDIASNFDAADANGDGKVTVSETMAYENSKNSSSTNNISASASSTTASSDTDTKLMTQMMDLLKMMQDYHGESSTNQTLKFASF